MPSTCGDVRRSWGTSRRSRKSSAAICWPFGSWVNALAYSGFSVSTGPAVSNFPLERTALFQAEYERQSALHAQAKKDRKKAAEAARREQKSEKKKAKKAAEAAGGAE